MRNLQVKAQRLVVIAMILGSVIGSQNIAFQSSAPEIALDRAGGVLGQPVTVTGTGFVARELVDLWWRTDKADPVTTSLTSATGTFTATFSLPDAPNGPQTIFAKGRKSERQATAVYTVDRPIGHTSRINEGVYDIYATRVGLVGGTTSSGHQVAEEDFFVALPSCTPTSCPRGATHGRMTDCRERCYVKIVNPQTKACRVEPILDVGPWFRVDDWWNPDDERYLNSISSNPTELVHGYPAAVAARDGYNVGYGIGPNGFGNDDTGAQGDRPVREVGNRAAIDLADGTWNALGLVSDGTGTQVQIELLWQTAADPAAEAQACGHPFNLSPSTG